MKKLQQISVCIVIITLLIMVLNLLFFSLPDWVVRIDGIVMIIGIFLASYSTVKCMKK